MQFALLSLLLTVPAADSSVIVLDEVPGSTERIRAELSGMPGRSLMVGLKVGAP